jgi:site-specific recombinase XerD
MILREYLKSKYSATSIRSYENMIRRFRLSLGELADGAGYHDVLDYIGQLRGQGLHPKSLRNNLFAVKIYFDYLLATGNRNDHPCRYLNLKDQVNRQIAVESLYSREVLEELYEHYQAKKPENQRRDKIIISLLIYQALTVLEISQLRVEDVNLEAGTIYIRENVKNRGRTLDLKPRQILLMHTYLKANPGKPDGNGAGWKWYWRKRPPRKRFDYFILSENGLQLWKSGINRMINRGREKQDRLTPLKIRQSVIANLLKEGHDLRVVQVFAGHRRTASTEAYKQTGLEELKAAIEKLHPLQ